MSSLKDHCADCKLALGEEFKDVHIWLDEMYKYTPGDFRHRAYRHHDLGIRQVKEKWGDKAAQAAEIHIRKDFPGLDGIPTIKDWQDTKKMLNASDFMMEIVNEWEKCHEKNIRKNIR